MKRLLFLLFAVPVLAQQPAPQVPQREQATVQDLKDQIADCSINSRKDAQYVAKLVDRIAELEKELAALKAPPKVSEKAK